MRLPRTVVAAVAVALVAGCDDPAPVPTVVSVSPSSADLAAFGETVRFTATVTDQNGDPMTGVAVRWSSGASAIATVDATGLVTAAGNGRATITARAETASGEAAVTVEQLPADVMLDPDSLAFAAFGDTAMLAVAVVDANGHPIVGASVEWASGDTTIADVSAKGLVTAAGNGVAEITATSGQATGTAAVSVEQLPAVVTLDPDSLAFAALGDTATLAATVVDANGHAVEEVSLTWTTGDTAVATISPRGVVTAVGNGTATVTAAAGEVSGEAVAVVAQVVDRVVVTPSADTVVLGTLVRLSAEAFDANGHQVDGASFRWSSGDAGVATVEGSGVVRGVGVGGPVTITAAAESATGTADVIVVYSPDRSVLEALYEATSGPNWGNNLKWMEGDQPIGDWFGVTTDSVGRATSVDLSSNGLNGPLPEELGDLEHLQMLQLFGNRLTGPIPSELGRLRKLTTLGLASNFGLSGPIPPELGDLGKLEFLWLYGNKLSGSIPAELGKLSRLESLALVGNSLTGRIPPELGDLSNVTYMHLGSNQLTGSIPPELGKLSKVSYVNLARNQLSGPMPPELGDLGQVYWLTLDGNQLTGPIPPELGRISRVNELNLSGNELSGEIPPELGDLGDLEVLELGHNKLSGTIPAELGKLDNLETLVLTENDLTGEIPPELGDMSSLQTLVLTANNLTEIPAELGDMRSLQTLDLAFNDLSGDLPPEMGGLGQLRELYLHGNSRLTGGIPADFGGLDSLRTLVLSDNSEMEGALPDELIDLGEIRTLLAPGTGLCAPDEDDFREWLDGIYRLRIATCAESPAAYLVQAVQSRGYPVPLVEDERALLRVFLTANRRDESVDIPGVQARFYANDKEIHSEYIPGKKGPIPTEIDEGDLAKSVNLEVEGSVIQEGLEVVMEVDSVDARLGVARRIPETGRIEVNVKAVPRFDVTIIPFLWTSDPDSSIIDTVDDMADDPDGHELFRDTRTLLPINTIRAKAHEPVESSTNNAILLLYRTQAIRVMEGRTGYYMGTMPWPLTAAIGVAYAPGRSSFSIPLAGTIAHELGHNMSLYHAPCGNPAGVDLGYPYPNGEVGAWGYDFEAAEVVENTTRDLMSYCGPAWISDYHFSNMARFRGHDDDQDTLPMLSNGLLLWGGIGADGTPFLEPSFIVDAPATLPQGSGDHRLEGLGADGAVLFSIGFEMPVVADAEGGAGFAFVLPGEPDWDTSLAAITLSGPGGSASLDRETVRPMAILRNARTGQVRAILELPEHALTDADAAAELAPGPGVRLRFSRGIPDPEAWSR